MKRRDFVVSATSAAGLALVGRAHGAPCPPTLGIIGGSAEPPLTCPASTEAPPWARDAISGGWNVGEWLAISGPTPTSGYGLSATNTLQSVATAPVGALEDALIHAWNGGTLCHGHRNFGVYMLGPAGAHNQYDRGDMYMFDLETRRWEQVAPPNTSYSVGNQFGEYNNGAPLTNHTVFFPFYDSHRNEHALPKGWGSPSGGSDTYPIPYGHGFSLSAYDGSGYSPAQWRRYPRLDTLSGSGGAGPSEQMAGLGAQCGGCWDEVRKSYWLVGAHNSISTSGLVAKYDSVANAWTEYAQQFSVYLLGSYAIDPVRDVLVMPGGMDQFAQSLFCLSLANPNARRQTNRLWEAVEQGTPPSTYAELGWVWSPGRNGFLCYDWWGSRTQVKLARYVSGGNFTAGQNTDYTLAWSNLLAASNAVSPPAVKSAGAFSRFRLARWGATEIALFTGNITGPVYAFRVT
jgi:hypothetical protein